MTTPTASEFRDEIRSRLQEFQDAEAKYLTARGQLYEVVIEAVRAKRITKTELSSMTGISRVTINKLT